MPSLNFAESTPALLIPLVWIMVACVCVGALVTEMPLPARRRLVAAGAGALLAAALVIAIFARYPDFDEAEHLHTTWLVARGLLPFRDFFQHHTPMLWVTLAPLLRLLPTGGYIFLAARLFALALSALAWCVGYRLALRVHGKGAAADVAPVMVLLAACALIPGEYFVLRPDLVSNILSLLAVGAMLRRADWRAAGLGGLLLGLALSYNPKHWPLVMVLPAALLSVRGGLWSGVRLSVVHALGVALGLVPMVAWLWSHGLVAGFVAWVLRFNSEQGSLVGGPLPVAWVALAGAWAWRGGAGRWQELGHSRRLVSAALVAASLILLLYGASFLKMTYHLQVFLILASAAGAAEGARFFAWARASRRGWLAGAVVAVCVVPVVRWGGVLPAGNLMAACHEAALLQQVAQGEPVLCVPPRHPIFAPDATYMQQPWEWLYFLRFPEVAAHLADIDDQITSRRPVVIFAGEPRQTIGRTHYPRDGARYSFIERFTNWGNITLPRAMRLQCFLEREYHFVRLERHWYWVRRDRALPPEAVVDDFSSRPAMPPYVRWNAELEEPR
jgi:hypothetical protein